MQFPYPVSDIEAWARHADSLGVPMDYEVDEEALEALSRKQKDLAIKRMRELEELRRASPLHFYNPYRNPKQHVFHSFRTRRRAFLGGNQCLLGDTEVRMADGSVRAIRDVREGDYVFGVDRGGHTRPVRVVEAYANGLRAVYRWRFRKRSRELSVCATADHSILARYEGKRIRTVELGRISTPEGRASRWSAQGAYGFDLPEGEREEWALILGLMLGDGCTTRKQRQAQFTCADPEIEELAREAVGALGYWLDQNRAAPIQFLIRPEDGAVATEPFLDVAEQFQMRCYAHEKRIPDVCWQWSNDGLARLLAGLFLTDGSVFRSAGNECVVNLSSVSLRLLEDVQTLLATRFGIHGTLFTSKQRANRDRPEHSFKVCARADLERFQDAIPLIGEKARKLTRYLGEWNSPKRPDGARLPFRGRDFLGYLPTYDLLVDHPDHLFLLGNGLVVSNSGKTTGGIVDCLIQAQDAESLPKWLSPYKRFRAPFRCRVGAQGRTETEDFIFEKIRDWVTPQQLQGGSWKTAYDGNNYILHFANGSYFSFKCFSPEQRAMMADGTWREVGKLQEGDPVETRFGPRRVTGMYRYEDAPLVRIRARGGYELVTTPNHPHLLTNAEWRQAGDIREGDELAIATTRALSGAKTMEDWQLGWLALLIGDGCVTGSNMTPMVSVAKDSPLWDELPPVPPEIRLRRQTGHGGRCDTLFLSTTNKNNPVKGWLKEIGMWGRRSDEKFIPDEVFTQPPEARKAFLRWLWGTDGTVSKDKRVAAYTTCSPRLVQDVKLLLRSVGLNATITVAGERHFRLSLNGSQFGTFSVEIGKAGYPREETHNGTAKYIPGTVFSVEDAGRGPVCCPVVEEVHELIVDGIVTSNTYDQETNKWGGSTLDRVYFDEEPPADKLGEARLRVMRKSGDLLFAMTPINGITHMFDEFEPYIEKADQGEGWSQDGSMGLVLVDMDDNPWLSEEDKDEALKGFSEEERVARKSGRFMALHGLIYSDFSTEEHVIPDAESVPENANVIVGIDPGWAKDAGCAVVWAYLTPRDELVVFEEFLVPSATIRQICERIHEVNAHYEITPIYYVIDPVARNKLSQTGRSDQMIFADHGVVCIAGQNAVDHGIVMVRERLQAGTLKIWDNCDGLIREFRTYRWKNPPRTGEDGKPRPFKKHDHRLDALRYLVASRPYLPDEPVDDDTTPLERKMREHQEQFSKPSVPVV